MSSDDQILMEATQEEDSSSLVAFQASFTGPLPHPQILAMYEEVLSGSAERILTMAEAQQAHRIKWEAQNTEVARSAQQGAIRGQHAAMAVAGSSVVATLITAFLDPSWVVAVIAAPAMFIAAGWAIRGGSLLQVLIPLEKEDEEDEA